MWKSCQDSKRYLCWWPFISQVTTYSMWPTIAHRETGSQSNELNVLVQVRWQVLPRHSPATMMPLMMTPWMWRHNSKSLTSQCWSGQPPKHWTRTNNICLHSLFVNEQNVCLTMTNITTTITGYNNNYKTIITHWTARLVSKRLEIIRANRERTWNSKRLSFEDFHC